MSAILTLRRIFLATTIGGLLSFAFQANLQAEVTIDPALPTYKVVPGLSGQIKSVGSDSINSRKNTKAFVRKWKDKGLRKPCRH